MTDLRERFLGSILGCAVGDALGAPFDGAAIAERFIELWQTGEIVGAGASCSEAVYNMVNLGASWRDAGTPRGRAGNGTAMRAAPIGLWNHARPDMIESDAEVSSIITHKDPRSVGGTIAVAKAVAICVNSDEIAAPDFLRDISDGVRTRSALFADCIDELSGWLDMEPSEALPLIYASGEPDMGPRRPGWVTAYVIPTVVCALYFFLKSPRDFMAALTGSICAGGDVDTVGAIAGAIGGAFNGISSIPRGLVDTLKDSERIIALTEEFHDVTMSRN